MYGDVEGRDREHLVSDGGHRRRRAARQIQMHGQYWTRGQYTMHGLCSWPRPHPKIISEVVQHLVRLRFRSEILTWKRNRILIFCVQEAQNVLTLTHHWIPPYYHRYSEEAFVPRNLFCFERFIYTIGIQQ